MEMNMIMQIKQLTAHYHSIGLLSNVKLTFPRLICNLKSKGRLSQLKHVHNRAKVVQHRIAYKIREVWPSTP